MKTIFLLLFAFTLSALPAASQTTASISTDETKTIQATNVDGVLSYPNPSNGLFYLRIPSITPETNITITVYDLKGNLVMSESGSGNTAIIDIHDSPAGVYMVYVVGDGVFSKRKVSVVK